MSYTQQSAEPVHVIQVGWDTSLFEKDAASDSLARQRLYGDLLAERRPGSRNTVVVLGAAPDAASFEVGNVTAIPVPGRWQSILRLGRVLGRISQARPISVIATQSVLEEAWASLLFARRRGVPVVAQLHFDLFSDEALPAGSPVTYWLGRVRRNLAVRFLPAYAGVRAVSRDLAERLAASGAHGVRHLPVPILDLPDLLTAPIGGREPRVLFVGRLAPEKNVSLWLDVARRIRDVRPDVQFDIAGDGVLRPVLEAEARRHGIGDAVTFHGAVRRAAVPDLYRRASVLLLTSRHEGFGRVLIEAMAAGVPVVATRTSGAIEVLMEGEAGFLHPLDDAEGLARSVLALLADPASAAATCAKARRRVVQHYDPLTLARQWIDMIIEAADTSRA